MTGEDAPETGEDDVVVRDGDVADDEDVDGDVAGDEDVDGDVAGDEDVDGDIADDEDVDANADGRSDDRPVESDGADSQTGDATTVTAATDETGRREVEVPLRLYKTVTVFSTLIAVVAVVLGFVLLDAATLQVSLLRQFVADLLAAVGLEVASGTLTAVFAAAGLLAIAGGAGVYVFGTRFRAPGMGNAQEERDERSNDG